MRGLEESTFRGARLDRALANVTWCTIFPNATVSHLPKLHSDHVPLLLNLNSMEVRPCQRSFKFQAAWVRHDSFNDTVNEAWIRDGNLISNLAIVADRLKVWNVETFGNVYRRKRKLMARLAVPRRLDHIWGSFHQVLPCLFGCEMEEETYFPVERHGRGLGT
ncbi:hypothetical protein PTKIN_Ptkin15bG0047900 [Pterospermum kingtungense]